jgi:transposase
MCHLDYAPTDLPPRPNVSIDLAQCRKEQAHFRGKEHLTLAVWDVIIVTHMPKRPPRPSDPKSAALRAAGALHPRPEAVQDEAFSRHEFFDRRDRVQVKYEMLRRHRLEDRPVTEVATAFGVSRQAFYKAETAFRSGGLPGLLPRRRGPRRAHKCSDALLDFVEQWRAAPASEREANLVEAIRRRFQVSLHPRSIQRALARRKKKRQVRRESQR